MPTVQERAKEFAKGIIPSNIEDLEYEDILFMLQEAYRIGAEKQKEIDEEVRLKKSDSMSDAEYNREVAFADWYLKKGKSTPTFSDAIEWTRRIILNKLKRFNQRNPQATITDAIQYIEDAF